MGGGVSFTGCSYVLLVNNNVYHFFFNTTSGNYPSLQAGIAQIMATVRVNVRPTPETQAGPVDQGGVLRRDTTTRGTTIQEMDFSLDLAPGWQPSNDPQGAKYRLYNQNGQLLGSLFIFEPDPGAVILSLLGNADADQLLQSALETKKRELFKDLGNYTPVDTIKTKLGGLDALIHDFNFSQGLTQGYYRWYFVAYKPKQDEGSTVYATQVYQFAFMTTALAQLNVLKPQFDAIMGSVRPKGAPALQAVRTEGRPSQKLPEPTNINKLPSLVPAVGEAGVYQDSDGRFRISFPAGTQFLRKDGKMSSYKNTQKNAYFQVWSFPTVNEAVGMRDYAMKDKNLNGEVVTWEVSREEVLVGLYTGGTQAGDAKATIAVVYPSVSGLLLIEIPAKDYAGAQDWITSLIKSIEFLK
jgi:hypothetical protein